MKKSIWTILLLTLLTVSCNSAKKEVEASSNSKNDNIEVEKVSPNINFEMIPDKTEMIFGDSLELKLLLEIDDSIVFAEYMFSIDDTLRFLDWTEDKWRPTTKHPVWFQGGPGKHFVRGEIKINLPDTIFWEKWGFEFKITEN